MNFAVVTIGLAALSPPLALLNIWAKRKRQFIYDKAAQDKITLGDDLVKASAKLSRIEHSAAFAVIVCFAFNHIFIQMTGVRVMAAATVSLRIQLLAWMVSFISLIAAASFSRKGWR